MHAAMNRQGEQKKNKGGGRSARATQRLSCFVCFCLYPREGSHTGYALFTRRRGCCSVDNGWLWRFKRQTTESGETGETAIDKRDRGQDPFADPRTVYPADLATQSVWLALSPQRDKRGLYLLRSG